MHAVHVFPSTRSVRLLVSPLLPDNLLQFLRGLRDGGAKDFVAISGNQQVVLDTDAAEVAVLLHLVVVDELLEFALVLPDVNQLRNEIDARFDGHDEAGFQLTGHTQGAPAEDVAAAHGIVIADEVLAEVFQPNW